MPVALGDPNLSVQEKINIAFDRVERFSPQLAAVFKSEAANFFASANFSSATLVDVPDSNHIGFQTGCNIEQLAIRVEKERTIELGGFQYWVQKNIWQALDRDHQAGLGQESRSEKG